MQAPHDIKQPSVIDRVLSGSGACRFSLPDRGSGAPNGASNNHAAQDRRARPALRIVDISRNQVCVTCCADAAPFGAPLRRLCASEPCFRARGSFRSFGGFRRLCRAHVQPLKAAPLSWSGRQTETSRGWLARHIRRRRTSRRGIYPIPAHQPASDLSDSGQLEVAPSNRRL